MVESSGATSQRSIAAGNQGLRGPNKLAAWHGVVENCVLDLHASAHSSVSNPDVAMTGITQERSGLVRISSTPCHVARAPRLGGDGWGDSIVVNVVLSGKLLAEQGGRQVSVGAGDGILCLAEKPYSLCFPEAFEAIVVRFDRSYFAHLPLVARSHLAELSRAGPVGDLVCAFARDFGRAAATLDASANAQLIQRLADLLETALSVMIDGDGKHLHQHPIAVLSQVKAYIRDRLADPSLSPQHVSDATNLSSRHLRKLFAEDGSSIRQYILERRLALCASDLRDPHFLKIPINTIAFRHGFKDAAHFSRAFRAQFALTPSEYQERAFERQIREP